MIETIGGRIARTNVGYAESWPKEHVRVSEPDARVNPAAGSSMQMEAEGRMALQLPKALFGGAWTGHAGWLAVGG